MVAINHQLSGIKMCLRPSMNKFKGRDEEFAEIEIARAFERPNHACGLSFFRFSSSVEFCLTISIQI